MRIKAVSAATALALFACAAVAAAGSPDEVATELKAEYKKGTSENPYVPERDPAFKGTVETKGNSCEARRKVKVRGVGSDKTDSKGRFKIDASGAGADTYTVKVTEREVGDVVCGAAREKVRVKSSDL